MASPSVTYTFTNSTTADATQVNQNFTDLISGMTDGSKSFSIDALTCAGTATFNGAVNLGNATADDITFTGYIASTLIPKTDDTYDLGTAALAWQDLYLDGVLYTDAIVSSAAGVSITTHNSAGDDFTVNTTAMVVEGDTGRVGIGTATPAVAFDVVGAIAASTTVTATLGAITATHGDVVIGTAGHGIDFGANHSANSHSKLILDTYEQGTFTPAFVAASVVFTYNRQVGNYTRIGNTVFIQVTLIASATGSTGNTLEGISGLPFTALNDGAIRCGMALSYIEWTVVPSIFTVENTTQLNMLTQLGADIVVTDTGMQSGLKYCTFSGTYFV
jgi:hypothetical protein